MFSLRNIQRRNLVNFSFHPWNMSDLFGMYFFFFGIVIERKGYNVNIICSYRATVVRQTIYSVCDTEWSAATRLDVSRKQGDSSWLGEKRKQSRETSWLPWVSAIHHSRRLVCLLQVHWLTHKGRVSNRPRHFLLSWKLKGYQWTQSPVITTIKT